LVTRAFLQLINSHVILLLKDPMKNTSVVALIQARGGSKGVPQKNIRNLAGFPLLAWSVAACKMVKSIGRTVLSTDCEEIAAIGKAFGAEVPFMRPDEFAADDSTDFDVIKHALHWFQKNEDNVPQYIVQIRPTTPLRDPQLMDEAIKKIQSRPEATGLRSVYEIAESPCKMFGMRDDYLEGLCPNDPRPEYFNLPRQAFPPTYFAHGYVDIVKAETILTKDLCYGNRMLGFLAPDTGEIDREEDFHKLEFNLSRFDGSVAEYLNTNFPDKKS